MSSTAVAAAASNSRPQPVVWRERVERFGLEGSLVGIVTEPAASDRRAKRPAFIFISAGMVHRVGPNRLYVKMARRVAAAGFTAVRFDLSGIGDSTHRSDDVPADQSAILECQQVLDALGAASTTDTFVLLGLCSGAVTAFRTAVCDPRVVGALLLNPQGFDHDQAWNGQVENRREARRYVSEALLDPARWWRALTGRIDYRRLVGVVARRAADVGGHATTKSQVAAGLAGLFQQLAARQTDVLVACCEGDSSVDYMTTILGRAAFREHNDGRLILRLFRRTDHSFTVGSSQQALFDLLDAWIRRFQ